MFGSYLEGIETPDGQKPDCQQNQPGLDRTLKGLKPLTDLAKAIADVTVWIVP